MFPIIRCRNGLLTLLLFLLISMLVVVGCKYKAPGSVPSLGDICYEVTCSEFLYDTASFSSCHAATITSLPGGDLVAAFFGGSWEGCNDVCIWMCRKERGASGWSEPAVVASGHVGDSIPHPCWNPVLYQVPGSQGELMLFYKTGIYIKDWVGHLMRSRDGGRSWTEPEPLGRYEYDQGDFSFLGAIKNKPVKVGRSIIAPSSDESIRWKIHFEVSEDGGAHWRYVHVPSADTIVSIQPAILKHQDGTLQALCRTKNGYLSTTYSHDGGLSWEPERLTDIPNNNSGIDCETLSNGLFAMVYNPAGKDRGKEFGPRTPLVLAFSADGLHWHDAITLEEGEGEFSYPSVIESDGALHIVYTWNRKRIKYVRVVPSSQRQLIHPA
jgi:alpha-L-rhamnosidase